MKRIASSNKTERSKWLLHAMKLACVALIALWLGTTSQAAHAQERCPYVREAIQIASEISETASQEGGGEFYRNQVQVTYQRGERVFLSSSNDGSGDISTDDLVTVRADPSGKEYRHDFRHSSRTRILSIPPPDISELFSPGENRVELVVTDLMGPVYSTRPYFLVMVKPCATATPTATASPIPTQTATSTQRPTATETATLTQQPTETETATLTQQPTETKMPTQQPTASATPAAISVAAALPTSTATSTATASVTPTPTASPTPTVLPLLTRCCDFSGAVIDPRLLLGGLVAASVVGSGLWLLTRGSRLADSLEIVDQDGASAWTVNLRDLRGEIAIGSDAKIRLDDDDLPAIAARIRHESSEDGLQAIWEDLDEQGSVLDSHPLHHLDVEQIGRYRITYYNYPQAAQEAQTSEGGIWHETQT